METVDKLKERVENLEQENKKLKRQLEVLGYTPDGNAVDLTDEEIMEKFVNLTTEAACLYGWDLAVHSPVSEDDDVEYVAIGTSEMLDRIDKALAEEDSHVSLHKMPSRDEMH